MNKSKKINGLGHGELVGEELSLPSNMDKGKTLSSSSSTFMTSPILSVSPMIKDYVWGGTRLIDSSFAKYSHNIAEIWSVSTHVENECHVVNARSESEPLKDVLSAREDGQLFDSGQVDHLIKYLDCQKSLSIQIHPSEATATFLHENKDHFSEFNLKDAVGKEEIFYVLDYAKTTAGQLFRGFNYSALQPIAKSLLGILESHSYFSNAPLSCCVSELITRGWSKVWNAYLLSSVKPALALNDDDARDFDVVLSSALGEQDDLDLLTQVFQYHLYKTAGEESRRLDIRNTLVGNEYIFSAIIVIYAIRRLSAWLAKKIDVSPELYDKARSLYEFNSDVHEQAPASVLRFFELCQVEKNQWIRIPPGTMHAWQGGGNFLVEIAGSSNNTFRIVDFGRELKDATRRPMHYAEAMYALHADTLFADNYWSFDDHTQSTDLEIEGTGNKYCPESYHIQRKCSVHTQSVDAPKKSARDWFSLQGNAKNWRVVTTADGPIRIRSDLPEGEAGTVVTIPTYNSVLLAPNTKASVSTQGELDRIIQIDLGFTPPPLLTIRLDVVDVYAMYHHKTGFPDHIRFDLNCSDVKEYGLAHAGSTASCSSSAIFTNKIQGLFRQLRKNIERISIPSDFLNIAVVWPGHILGGGSRSRHLLISETYGNVFDEIFSDLLLKILGKTVISKNITFKFVSSTEWKIGHYRRCDIATSKQLMGGLYLDFNSLLHLEYRPKIRESLPVNILKKINHLFNFASPFSYIDLGDGGIEMMSSVELRDIFFGEDETSSYLSLEEKNSKKMSSFVNVSAGKYFSRWGMVIDLASYIHFSRPDCHSLFFSSFPFLSECFQDLDVERETACLTVSEYNVIYSNLSGLDVDADVVLIKINGMLRDNAKLADIFSFFIERYARRLDDYMQKLMSLFALVLCGDYRLENISSVLLVGLPDFSTSTDDALKKEKLDECLLISALDSIKQDNDLLYTKLSYVE